MSPAVRERATAEAKVDFVHYVDAGTGTGKTIGDLYRDAFVRGFARGRSPRSMAQIESEMAAILAAEDGARA